MRKPPPLKAYIALRMRSAEAAALDAACAMTHENRSALVRRVLFEEVRRVIEGNAVLERAESLVAGAER